MARTTPSLPGTWQLLALISGGSTLALEVAWLKRFSQVLGADIPALTAVTAALFLGLAAGNTIAARLAARVASPLRAFSAVEIAVAAAAACTLPALGWLPTFLAPLYPGHPTFSFELLRFVGASSILLVPTTLMGIGLPLLTEATRRRRGLPGESFNRLYAANTIGAALGCLIAGFVLIPNLGVTLGLLAATAGHALNALFAFRLAAGATAEAVATEAEPSPRAAKTRPAAAAAGTTPRRMSRGLAVLFPFLLGVPTIVYEATWSRSLVLILGSTTYAYSILLAVFILGLGAGPLLVARATDRVRQPWAWVAGLQFAIAISAFGVKVLVGQLPLWVGGPLARYAQSFGGFMLVEASIAAMVLIVPTLLLGCAFAFAARAVQESFASGGEGAGTFLGANTLGNTTGSLAATFLLIPALGIQGSITVASALTVGLGFWAAWLAKPEPRTAAIGGAAALMWAALAVMVPRWDPLLISSGPFLAATEGAANYGARTTAEAAGVSVLAHEEGVMATVMVMEDVRGERSLTLNGKTTASTVNDIPTELLSGHLPLLLAPAAKNVLVIGLGCGASAAAVARHPVEHIDVAEISAEVVELQPLFASVNRDILDDPRVRMLTIDGRTHLTYTDQTYDVITSEPSNPWIAGVGNLFSHEFFEACRRHLAPGGVHAQWLQGYGLSRHDVASVIATFRDVYPEATVWEPAWGSDFLLVAKRDGAVTLADLDRVWSRSAGDLATIGIRVPDDLLMTFLGGPSLAESVDGGTIVTDDNLHLEFAAAKRVREVAGAQYLTERSLATAEGVGGLRTVLRGDDATVARLERGLARRRAAYSAWATDPTHRFEKTLAALHADGVPPEQGLQLSRIMFAGLQFEIELFRRAQAAFDAEDFATAQRLLEQVLVVSPDHAEALEILGESRFMAANAPGAIEALSRAVARQPERWRAYNILGAALATAGRPTDAIAAFERVPRSAGEPYEQAQTNLARARAMVNGR